jgi:hypothetical protein
MRWLHGGEGENGSEAEKKEGDERHAVGWLNGVGSERTAVRQRRKRVTNETEWE